jgi:hypothetical protein
MQLHAQGVTLTTHPHLVLRSRLISGYFLSSLVYTWRSGTASLSILIYIV